MRGWVCEWEACAKLVKQRQSSFSISSEPETDLGNDFYSIETITYHKCLAHTFSLFGLKH